MKFTTLLAVTVLTLAACQEEGTGEQIGAEVDSLAGDLQNRARDVADSIGDAARDARDVVEDTATNAGNAIEDLCEDATDRDC